ncbi:MAG: NADH-quinone oxidoreductase subunit J [Flavobacteriales bacterium]|nr:NADH-quinone oxidoreductase subunit J [Flavobacteriales bacterium]
MVQYLFWFLAFVAVFSAVAFILAKNPVHSVLYLIVTFFSIAGHYFLLNAQFLAAVHIIVYAGAIMVLFLYVIMMLNINRIEEESKTNRMKLVSVVSAGLLMIVMVAVLRRTDEVISTVAVHDPEMGLTQHLGQVLYKEFLLPFEISSILFLAAMVGAVYLSKKDAITKVQGEQGSKISSTRN